MAYFKEFGLKGASYLTCLCLGGEEEDTIDSAIS